MRRTKRNRTIMLRLVIAIILAGGCCLMTGTRVSRAMPPVNSFDILVPHKTGGSQIEIKKLKVTVSVTTTNPVTFTVTPPAGGTAVTTMPAVMPGGPTFPAMGTASLGGAPTNDTMKVFPPPAGGGTDPATRKYVIIINLNSNLDSACVSTMMADETWTISVGGGGGAQIDGACVQSLDQNVGACGTALRTVPLNDDPMPNRSVATIVGASAAQIGCRPGVDAVLVLDRSGSMDGAVLGGPNPTQHKLVALQSAVSNFMLAWKALRANEINTMQGGNPNIQATTDRVGVVFFDSDPPKWLKQLVPASSTAVGMDTMSDAIADDISLRTQSVVTGSATSIGSGLLLAANALAPCTNVANRKVIVVMSDGMENSDPHTNTVPMVNPNQVQTVNGTNATNLPCQPPTQIYALTVGSTGTINPTINQALANASGGFYLNSEYDSNILSSFFTEVLQNFIKYSTVETYVMISDKTSLTAPFTRPLPVTTTTTSLTFTLSWDASRGPLKLTVTPPGGGVPVVRKVAASDAPGSMVLNLPLPAKGMLAAGGNWAIRIEPDSTLIGALKLPPLGDEVPFNLIVLGDDTAINSDLTTVAADYAPGDQIRLSARITELGEPVLGATVLADLVRPDAGGIGDLLSASTATASQPASADQLSAADAKLQNTLKADSNAIKRAQGVVQLLDNGNAANGDLVAGDGIYSALFPSQLIGHYSFTIGAVGTTQHAGTFSRQQLRTVHVRAVPDGAKTTVSTSVQTGTPNFLVVDMTPLTKFGNHLGPGWGNYFWVTGNGMNPVNFNDNLNGTYTAKIPFTGNPPSGVKIHFERVTELIPDNTPPDKLPVPLGSGTVVVSHVPVPGGGSGNFKHWGLSLHGGVSIPHGNFNTFFNPGPNFAVDLEYRINNTFSVEGIYGFHHFRGATIGPVMIGDLNVHQFSFNGKVYGSSSPVRPFFNFGGGAYKFDPGSTHGGLNVGVGVQFDVTPAFAIEGLYNFHNVFTSGSNTRFSAVQGGVRFRF
jgi:hypothetical protein